MQYTNTHAHNKCTFGWFINLDYTLRWYHLGTSTRPSAANMEPEASVSIFLESDGEQVSDILPGNKDSKPAIPLLLDHVYTSSAKVRAKAETTCSC